MKTLAMPTAASGPRPRSSITPRSRMRNHVSCPARERPSIVKRPALSVKKSLSIPASGAPRAGSGGARGHSIGVQGEVPRRHAPRVESLLGRAAAAGAVDLADAPEGADEAVDVVR